MWVKSLFGEHDCCYRLFILLVISSRFSVGLYKLVFSTINSDSQQPQNILSVVVNGVRWEKVEYRCGTAVACAPVTQPARVRSPVETSFLGAAFFGVFPHL